MSEIKCTGVDCPLCSAGIPKKQKVQVLEYKNGKPTGKIFLVNADIMKKAYGTNGIGLKEVLEKYEQ